LEDKIQKEEVKMEGKGEENGKNEKIRKIESKSINCVPNGRK
jgi:hypothetical protein